MVFISNDGLYYFILKMVMTKSNIIVYLSSVVIVTLLVFMYTSFVEAPNDTLNLNTNIENIDSAPNPTTVTQSDSATTSLPINQEKNEDQVIPPVISPTQSSTNLIENNLTEINWQWLHILDKEGRVTFTPKRPEAFKLKFTDSQINSTTDCNSISGSYQTKGDTLTFAPLMSTLMYCENSDELTYSTNISVVTSFRVTTDKLQLITSNGDTLVFEAK